MEDLARKTVLEIIRGVINELAFEELAKMPEKIAQKQKEIKMTKAQRSQQVHDDLFHGGDRKKDLDTKINLREGETINVSKSEIDEFQKELSSHLQGHAIKFQENQVGNQTSIVAFPVIDGNVDAVIKGIVDGELEFTMSLADGVKIKTKGVSITEENKELPSKLYNLYNKVFKQKFTDILSSKGDEEMTGTVEPMAGAAPGGSPEAVAPAAPAAGAVGAPGAAPGGGGAPAV